MRDERPGGHGLLRALAAAVFWLLVWQLAAMAVGQRILLASPVETLFRLFRLLPTGPFWRSVLSTLGHILSGYALACAAGGAVYFLLPYVGVESLYVRHVSGVALIFAIRALAIKYHLGVPVFTGRDSVFHHHHQHHHDREKRDRGK